MRVCLCVCVYEYRCERLVVRMCVSGQDTCGVWPYYYVYVIFVSEYMYEYEFSLTLAGGLAQRLASILVLLVQVPVFQESPPVRLVLRK